MLLSRKRPTSWKQPGFYLPSPWINFASPSASTNGITGHFHSSLSKSKHSSLAKGVKIAIEDVTITLVSTVVEERSFSQPYMLHSSCPFHSPGPIL